MLIVANTVRWRERMSKSFMAKIEVNSDTQDAASIQLIIENALLIHVGESSVEVTEDE